MLQFHFIISEKILFSSRRARQRLPSVCSAYSSEGQLNHDNYCWLDRLIRFLFSINTKSNRRWIVSAARFSLLNEQIVRDETQQSEAKKQSSLTFNRRVRTKTKRSERRKMPFLRVTLSTDVTNRSTRSVSCAAGWRVISSAPVFSFLFPKNRKQTFVRFPKLFFGQLTEKSSNLIVKKFN